MLHTELVHSNDLQQLEIFLLCWSWVLRSQWRSWELDRWVYTGSGSQSVAKRRERLLSTPRQAHNREAVTSSRPFEQLQCTPFPCLPLQPDHLTVPMCQQVESMIIFIIDHVIQVIEVFWLIGYTNIQYISVIKVFSY